MILYLEYTPANEEELMNRLKYVEKMGLLKKYFGEYCYQLKNPGTDSTKGEKQICK